MLQVAWFKGTCFVLVFGFWFVQQFIPFSPFSGFSSPASSCGLVNANARPKMGKVVPDGRRYRIRPCWGVVVR